MILESQNRKQVSREASSPAPPLPFRSLRVVARGGIVAAVCAVYYDVHILGRLGDSASVRRIYPFSEPAAGLSIGMFDAAVILLTSTIVFAILLAFFRGLGLRKSNLRAWHASFVAGVFTAVGDRMLNGPFEDWPSAYLQFTYLFRGRLNSVLGSWGTLHPLNRPRQHCATTRDRRYPSMSCRTLRAPSTEPRPSGSGPPPPTCACRPETTVID